MNEVTLVTDGIEVEIRPGLGGKISRLLDRRRGREWLVPTPGDATRAAPGSSFVESPLCGWDEMLPTILPCYYPAGDDRAGILLGDHGDAWTAGWDVTGQDERQAAMHADLTNLPLRLERLARVSGSTLRLDYTLSATGEETVLALWAAHPLFACMDQTRVVLPQEVREVLDVIEVRNQRPVAWPNGLDRVAGMPDGAGRKLYVPPTQRVASASLVDEDGSSLSMSWDPQRCPYLGLWLDNGYLSDGPMAALEPAIAFCDELALAAELGRTAEVRPGAPVTWWLEVSLA